eukprot:COSAG02_NODE_1384_length_12956_cov_126.308446_2_plen_138_part_00
MWQLACALVLLPLAAAGNDAYEEVDVWLDDAGSASWGPDDIVGYNCVTDSCEKVVHPAVAKFKGLAECKKSCTADKPADKKDGQTLVIAIIAAVGTLIVAVCAWKKCKSSKDDPLQQSLNKGINQKDRLDDPSAASW